MFKIIFIIFLLNKTIQAEEKKTESTVLKSNIESKSVTNVKTVTTVTPIDKLMVEKCMRSNFNAVGLFSLINSELNKAKLPKAEVSKLAAKIYWEVIEDMTNWLIIEKVGAESIGCVISAYALAEAAPIKIFLTPKLNDTEIDNTILEKVKTINNSNLKINEQIQKINSLTNIKDAFLLRIYKLFTNKKIISNEETMTIAYRNVIELQRSILLKNGATSQSLQIFYNKIIQTPCRNYFIAMNKYYVIKKANPILSRIPAVNKK